MREISAGARREDFLVTVLGHTACVEAAVPLVRLLGEGSATLKKALRLGGEAALAILA